jgi:hypothetical protein
MCRAFEHSEIGKDVEPKIQSDLTSEVLSMELTPEDKAQIRAKFDKCDAALVDKPILASIYDENWRKDWREKALSAQKHGEVNYGAMGYAAPIFEELGQCPKCYQYRLEEGANILLSKPDYKDESNLIDRMRGTQPTSAGEELLLARGFALKFGKDAVHVHTGLKSEPRPEFWISVSGQKIAIEAKGLLDSKTVRDLNEFSISSGQYYWISVDPSIGDPSHVRGALAKKILESSIHSPCVIVLTLYGGFDFLAGINLARQMAITPSNFKIPGKASPLAVALVEGLMLVQGVWFNLSVAQRIGISEQAKERIRMSVKESFWPRPDGVFLHEGMTDYEHNEAAKTILSKVGQSSSLLDKR